MSSVAVVGVASAFRHAGSRVAVLVVAREVPRGASIHEADLREALVAPDARLKTVRAAERGRFVGKTAAVDLLPGTNITEASVSSEPALDAGDALVGVALRDGRFPAGLRVGDAVRLLRVPARTDGSAAVVAGRAVVFSIGKRDQSLGTTDFELIVDAADTPSGSTSEYQAAAAAAARDELVVVRLGPQS